MGKARGLGVTGNVGAMFMGHQHGNGGKGHKARGSVGVGALWGGGKAGTGVLWGRWGKNPNCGVLGEWWW